MRRPHASSQSFLCGETATGSGKPPVLRSRQSVDLDNCTLFWTSSMPMRRSRSVEAAGCNFLSWFRLDYAGRYTGLQMAPNSTKVRGCALSLFETTTGT